MGVLHFHFFSCKEISWFQVKLEGNDKEEFYPCRKMFCPLYFPTFTLLSVEKYIRMTLHSYGHVFFPSCCILHMLPAVVTPSSNRVQLSPSEIGYLIAFRDLSGKSLFHDYSLVIRPNKASLQEDLQDFSTKCLSGVLRFDWRLLNDVISELLAKWSGRAADWSTRSGR